MSLYLITNVTLKMKIIFSFLISFIIILILGIIVYIDFIEIKHELYFLELAASIRTETLQLRRHEKNYLLYADNKEIKLVSKNVNRVKELIETEIRMNGPDRHLADLNERIIEYKKGFTKMTKIVSRFRILVKDLKEKYPNYKLLLKLTASTFLDHPAYNVEVLKKTPIHNENDIIESLISLESDIKFLRKNGENILLISKNMDKSARQKVEHIIRVSQQTAFILLPIAFFIGLGLILMISQNVVKRLKLLMEIVEKLGKGEYSPITIPSQHDEVSTLIKTFSQMRKDLKHRQRELKKKDQELMQSKKMASLGTLSSGVAHELNNPINNIYLAAQTLSQEMKDLTFNESNDLIFDSIADIYSQTIRAKTIVAELLEFSREKKLTFSELEISTIIQRVYYELLPSIKLSEIDFCIQGKAMLYCDQKQMEQVFINLFINAIEAMSGIGLLRVDIREGKENIIIVVSDTGSGIANQEIDRIFDPFYTNKDKGIGLGLAIVYNIIQQHHGKIIVESELDRETSFIIRLQRNKLL